MILTALNDYYQRLLANPDPVSGLAKVPPYGFTDEKIGYVLVLSKTGELVDAIPNFEQRGKKEVAKYMTLPWSFDRTGKFTEKAFASGKNPAFFLWDKPEFLLGVELADKKKGTWSVADLPFRATKQLHQNLINSCDDAGLKAVSQFFERWNPAEFAQSKITPEMLEFNLSFKLDGSFGLIGQTEAAKRIWLSHVAATQNSTQRHCLVTNELAALKETHPKIKGVSGGQSSGGAIVSFNAEAYTSYGKEQGDNAPVSEAAAFGYTTALNYLLRRNNGQCISIGDTSTVFWAVAADAAKASEAESLFGWMLNMPADDGGQAAQIRPVLEKIAQGKPLAEIAPDLAEGTRFYVLGLAPNASRLSIRYWMDTSFGELAKHVAQHFKDLALDPLPWNTAKPPSMQKLLLEVVPLRKKEGKYDYRNRKFDDIPPQLAGEFFRAILTGKNYPQSLLAKIIQRLRVDGDINKLRVSLVKAVLSRRQRLINSNSQKEEVSMALNKEDSNIAYRLGRLFAVLEQAQKAALGKLNAGIGDKYYGAASATPHSIFPSLVKNAKHHVASLRKGKKADWVKDAAKTAGWLEKEMGEIMLSFPSNSPFPKTLTLDDQGRFVIGYYHQRHTKQNDAPSDVVVIDELDTETTIETAGE